MEVREGNGDDVQAEAGVVFALGGDVFLVELSCELEQAADGEAHKEETDAGQNHGGRVERNREGVGLLFDDVRSKEGEQRGAEEEAEVGVEDAGIGPLDAPDEVVVIDPVNPGEREAEQIDEEDGRDCKKTGKAVLVGDLELKDHDGDDDGENSVGEGFEACCREEFFGHRSLRCFWE